MNRVSMESKPGISVRGAMASFISSMPNIKIAKPQRMEPVSFFFSLLAAISRITPMRAKIGEKFSGFSMEISRLSPSMPAMLRIQAVRVVPMLEPIIRPTVWLSSMMPELTSPTSITVMADED